MAIPIPILLNDNVLVNIITNTTKLLLAITISKNIVNTDFRHEVGIYMNSIDEIKRHWEMHCMSNVPPPQIVYYLGNEVEVVAGSKCYTLFGYTLFGRYTIGGGVLRIHPECVAIGE